MDLRTAQQILSGHGFPCGAADGVAGPVTTSQLGHFQQAFCGPGGWLAIDGKFGPATANALQWTQDNNALVSFFSIGEVACHHCGLAYVRRELLSAMFKARQNKGRPVVVVDAFRCPAHNAAIGGASNSEHPAGFAFDPLRGAFSIPEARAAGFTGIGLDSNGRIDHLDVRPGGLITFPDPGSG